MIVDCHVHLNNYEDDQITCEIETLLAGGMR
jgi:hypothetical protein